MKGVNNRGDGQGDLNEHRVDTMLVLSAKGRVHYDRIDKTAAELEVGKPTLKDIVDALAKPGRDPREDLPKPIFRNDVLTMEDLKPGMILTGTVRNVIDFGAFVDIGVKQDGLVHISELSDKYVKNPNDVVAVGDIVEVRVKEVDLVRKRIALSMKQEDTGETSQKPIAGGDEGKRPVRTANVPKKPAEKKDITMNSLRESFLKAGFKVK